MYTLRLGYNLKICIGNKKTFILKENGWENLVLRNTKNRQELFSKAPTQPFFPDSDIGLLSQEFCVLKSKVISIKKENHIIGVQKRILLVMN